MHLDQKILGGIFVGIVLGLHYHAALASYLPILIIISVIMVLRLITR